MLKEFCIKVAESNRVMLTRVVEKIKFINKFESNEKLNIENLKMDISTKNLINKSN